MSIIVGSSLPDRIDLATWDADISHRDDAYELVEGVPTMTPGESALNRAIGSLLAGRLNAHRNGWVAVTDVEVTLTEFPLATVRLPDVAVLRTSAVALTRDDESDRRVRPADVLLVAEVVSSSSIERDLVTKRREYAQAGIPAYLIVDLRSGSGELTLYTSRDSEFHYLDASPKASGNHQPQRHPHPHRRHRPLAVTRTPRPAPVLPSSEPD